MNVKKFHRSKHLHEERTFRRYPHTEKNLLSRKFFNQDYELHNPDGPALIIYDSGMVIREEYWLNDKRCTKEDILKINRKKKLKKIKKKCKK